MNCSRQWGKSTVTASKALHTAAETEEATVIVVSPSQRHSGEFVRKVKAFVRQLGWKTRSDGVNELSVVLPNGSRIVGLPGVEGTIRGFSAIDLLIVDEAARVSDEQYFAAGPMLAVKNGARGFFWKEWAHGGAE